eukprot:snap_masked-scaffold_24-processed-gene-5.11-mRNA-1 protein AED:1.00 eAED:1.00 QI:0/0/0/0/1/1/2/0/68
MLLLERVYESISGHHKKLFQYVLERQVVFLLGYDPWLLDRSEAFELPPDNIERRTFYGASFENTTDIA